MKKFAIALCACLAFHAACAEDDAARLAAIADRYFAEKLDLDPLLGSLLTGDARYEGRLAITIAPEEVAKARALNERVRRELATVDAGRLSATDRVTREMLDAEVTLAIDGDAFPTWLMPVDNFGGLPVQLATWAAGDQVQPLKTVQDFENYLRRLDRLPAWTTQAIANMREGVKRGWTVPRSLVEAALPTFDKLAEPDFDRSDFAAALKAMPPGFKPAERMRLDKAYRTAWRERLQPALAELAGFLRAEYLSACRTGAGVGTLPDGARYYAWAIRQHTTQALAADDIHATGLAEVARIRGEIDQVRIAMGRGGSVTDFLRWHAAEPRFRPYRTKQAVVDANLALDARIAPQLPRFFGRLPKRPLEIRPIPELQVAAGSSYYNPPSPDGTRPGVFFVWVDDPAKLVNAIDSSLLLHEGQPGHHFQMSLQQELDLPAFRKYGWSTAFGEGWALYAETLGFELGLYDDPNQRLGHLKLELLRAVRLVTDTGLHAKGWTRAQSIAYMMETEGRPESEAVNATERYMAAPGQALGYKIGALAIQAERRKAEQALGARFDIRGFHDVVLSQGTVTLDVLSRTVDEWVAARRGGAR